MGNPVSCIGFGEAGQALATGLTGPVRVYDRAIDGSGAAGKWAEYTACGVSGTNANREAVTGASLILSLVTADQALAAARETAAAIASGAFYCDMNSVAPQTKRAAADLIEGAGGHYVDVAVMAPVHPARHAVPLLVSGPHAEAAVAALTALGFTQVRALDGAIGTASSVKMIRSVMVKGIEALTAECLLAADAAGVLAEVITSLNASPAAADWWTRGDYNLDRMMMHGQRRAEEMREVVKTLAALGVDAGMARATIEHQRAIGQRGLKPPAGLADKLAALRPPREAAA